MLKIRVDAQLKAKILEGRKVVDAYRTAHIQLHSKPWYKGIPEEHTPLLNKMVDKLEKLGFTSIKTDFEPKKTEILAKFWEASDRYNWSLTGISDGMIWQTKQDLLLTVDSLNPEPGVVVNKDNVRVEVFEQNGRPVEVLYIDSEPVTDTRLKTHFEMRESVKKCPNNARVFIGGLGLGLILLYLAKSAKATEILVSEIDSRIVSLFGERFKNWFSENHPSSSFIIIEGDALQEITKRGKFDWVFFDLTRETPEEAIPSIEGALTLNGVYTDWWKVKDSLYEGWWR